ncbi:hypothetical protein MAJJADAN_00013 [Pseudomonas phage Amjad_SA]|nr:hypothetical protein MAJJADAN_00013 [Pseudomonas phage Amjad_SA]
MSGKEKERKPSGGSGEEVHGLAQVKLADLPELQPGVDVFFCKEVSIGNIDLIPESAYLAEAEYAARLELEAESEGLLDDANLPGLNLPEEIYQVGLAAGIEQPQNLPSAQQPGQAIAQTGAQSPRPAKERKRKDPFEIKSKMRPTLDPFWEMPESIKETLIGKLALSIAEAYEFPEFSAFITLLGAASCAVSCAYSTAYSGGERINAGLYVVVEQPPATGKSRILGVLMSEYSKAISAHNRKVAMKNREIAERQSVDIPCMPAAFNYTTEPTSAAMDGAMSRLFDGRFVVASSEQSAFKMLFPQGKAFASTNELLLKGWPGEEVAIMRGSRQAFSGKACGAVVLIAQDGSARSVLGESDGTGLAERFFFVAEPSLLGSRELLGLEPDHTLLLRVKNAMNRCVMTYSDLAFQRWSTGNYEQLSVDDLQVIQPDREGYVFLLDLRRKHEPTLKRLEDSGDKVAMGWLAKSETQIMKVATILHVIECLGAGCQVPSRIPIHLLHAASDLTDELFAHFMGMLHENGDSGVAAEEDAIVDVLTLKPMVRRQLMLKLKNRAPFRARGKNAYAAAGARIDAMLEQGSLVVTAAGKLEVV